MILLIWLAMSILLGTFWALTGRVLGEEAAGTLR